VDLKIMDGVVINVGKLKLKKRKGKAVEIVRT